MIEESKKIEFWNFLTTEKNQPRPKGITVQRLAVLKPAIIGSDDLWVEVIERYGAGERGAAEFYQSNESASASSRADFWGAIRKMIIQTENKGGRQLQRSEPEIKNNNPANYRKRRRKY